MGGDHTPTPTHLSSADQQRHSPLRGLWTPDHPRPDLRRRAPHPCLPWRHRRRLEPRTVTPQQMQPQARRTDGSTEGQRSTHATNGGIPMVTHCNCGAPAIYRNLGECKACYQRRYRAELRAGSRQQTPRSFERTGYHNAHWRVTNQRGPARHHTCVDCGQQAAEWSYHGGSQHEQVSPEGWAYSPDPNDYEPRCARCHRTYDEHWMTKQESYALAA